MTLICIKVAMVNVLSRADSSLMRQSKVLNAFLLLLLLLLFFNLKSFHLSGMIITIIIIIRNSYIAPNSTSLAQSTSQFKTRMDILKTTWRTGEDGLLWSPI